MKEIESIIAQLERQRQAVERALGALREIGEIGAASAGRKRGRPPGKKASSKKRKMSEEGRARIAEASRRRWAAVRSAKTAGA